MTPHSPVPNRTTPDLSAPTWPPVPPNPDLDEATTEDPSLGSWVTALASQGQTAMDDNLEEQLYSQAPDALRQAGLDPTPEAIESWVTARLRRARL